MGDRALVAQDRVAPALRPQLHLRRPRHAAQRARAHRPDRDPALRARVERRRRPAREQLERGVDVVDVDPAAHVRAADAELRRRAQHVAERRRRRDPERRPAAVGRRDLRPVPQGNGERPVRQCVGQRGTEVLRPAHVASLAACRSGAMRTTSQARPVFSSAQMTHAEGSNCQRDEPVAGRGGESVMVVVPRLAEREDRQPPQVAGLVAGLEPLAAEEVAERVDAVRRVVKDQHPHGAAPQQPGQGRGERAADQPAEQERHGEPGDHPQQERAADQVDDRVGDQVRRVARLQPALRCG